MREDDTAEAIPKEDDKLCAILMLLHARACTRKKAYIVMLGERKRGMYSMI